MLIFVCMCVYFRGRGESRASDRLDEKLIRHIVKHEQVCVRVHERQSWTELPDVCLQVCMVDSRCVTIVFVVCLSCVCVRVCV